MMSKHRYITVSASSERVYANIGLPENWDTMSDEDRITCLKQAAFEEMKYAGRSGHEQEKFWRRCVVDDLEDWQVESETRKSSVPIESAATKPKELLILDGSYESKVDIDDYDYDSDDAQ